MFFGRTDAKAETPILWPFGSKNWFIWKDPDAGKDWRQEKRITEDEMVAWHHRLNGHEFEQTLGDSEGQGSLVSESCSVVSYSLQPQGLYSPWNSPGQNTGVGSLSLLQWIIPTQGLNPGLPHSRRILYELSHKGSPRILGCSLFLLWGILPIQESNRCLLYFRWILYQLSYQGSPLS